tara:strand:- start:319 stop:954 length:636 start_codon:yes stop_codon:yes gene_type:complete
MIPFKICGITNINDAFAAIENKASAIGFIFVKDSPREISFETAKIISKKIGNNISKIGVFVNQDKEIIEKAVKSIPLNMIQLHGDENPSFCNSFTIPVIKAIQIKNHESINKAKKYNVNAILFDTYKKDIRGGTGNTFDWKILSSQKYDKPIILSGGLNKKNILKAINHVNPVAIDVNSGVEESPGKKSHLKIKNFYQTINQTKSTGFQFE